MHGRLLTPWFINQALIKAWALSWMTRLNGKACKSEQNKDCVRTRFSDTGNGNIILAPSATGT